ncbi:MAG: 30S ribosomal protein S6 [Candidatus Neomarinimicrobiota bacterium]
MRYYETIYIVNPNLDNSTLSNILVEIAKELAKTKSKVINHYNWGKKRLAYPIDKQKYGSYIILQYEGGDKSKINDFDTWLKLNNAIIRHMTILLDEKPKVHVEEKKKPNVDEEDKGNAEDTKNSKEDKKEV